MAAIVTVGELSQPHGDYVLGTLPIPSQAGVKIANKAIIVINDSYAPHVSVICTPGCPTHPSMASVGSPTVFVGGIGVVRDGDPLNCGGAADTQSNFSVFADGGGNAASIIAGFGGAEGEDVGETLGYSVIGINDSYPTLSVRARYTVSRAWSWAANNGEGGIVTTYTFQEWCPTTPVDPNGFQITLKEETTGSIYTSLRGVGATSIPVTAPATIRGPLDSRVSYTLENFDYGPYPILGPGQTHSPRYSITAYYSIDSTTGKMTFTRSAGVTKTHNVPGTIKVWYGTIRGEGSIVGEINVNARIGAGTAAC